MESGHIDVSHLQLLFGLTGVFGIVMSGYWAMTKMVIAAFRRSLDERFVAHEKATDKAQADWADRDRRSEARISILEQELRRVLIETPKEYVARSDYVRNETVIEGKIDLLRALRDGDRGKLEEMLIVMQQMSLGERRNAQ